MRSSGDTTHMTQTLMKYDGITGELKCYADGELVLSTIETDPKKAHAISDAIQRAFKIGGTSAILKMQSSVERCMTAFRGGV